MNVCIVTVYNSENCGSFYQSYALYKTLESEGHNVFFLRRDTRRTSHDKKMFLLRTAKAFLFGHPILAVQNIKRYHAFEKRSAQFPIIENNPEAWKEIDVFVIGSDTLWNFETSYFLQKHGLYTGKVFAGKRAITYAVSVANTPAEILTENTSVTEGIRGLATVSVRDRSTQKVAQEITGKTPALVIDPTFLLEEAFYHDMEQNIIEKDFILIYGFGKVPSEIREQLLDIRKKWGCQIVSFGAYRKWADISTVCDPGTFLTYFHRARCIVTDTYHGTAFSIIYKKKFISYGKHKNKVKELVESLELTAQFVEPGDSVLEKLQMQPDYKTTYDTLVKKRMQSLEFLRNNLEEAKQ